MARKNFLYAPIRLNASSVMWCNLISDNVGPRTALQVSESSSNENIKYKI